MSDPPEPGGPPDDDAELRVVERTGAHEPLNEAEDEVGRGAGRRRVPVLDDDESEPGAAPIGAPDTAVEAPAADAALETTMADDRPDLVAAAEAAALLTPDEVAALEAVLPADGEQTAAFESPLDLFAAIPDPEDAPEPQSIVLGNVPEADRPRFQQAPTEFVPAVRVAPPAAPLPAPRVVQVIPPEGPPALPTRKRPPTPPPEPSEPSVILDLKFNEADEVEARATGVFEPNRAGAELPRGRLVVQGGEFHGKTWYLNRARTQVGRGTDNDIVLLDIAVSREHARLDRHREGFRLVDLDSGNGSYVNGRRVTRCELYDGDRVEFGAICVEFSTVGAPRVRLDSQPAKITDPSIVIEAAHAPPKAYPMLWMVLWVCVTFAAVVGAVYLTRRLTRTPAESSTSDLASQARSWFARAEQAVSRRDWSVARQNVEVARKLAPTLLAYDDLAARIETAMADEVRVQAARSKLPADPQGALDLLAAIPPDGAYAREQAALQAEAEEALIAGLQKAAESALERGEDAVAKATAEQLLARAPDHERAKAILAAIAEQGGKVAGGAEGTGPTEPGPAGPGPTEPGPTEPGPTGPGPTGPGPTEPGPTGPGPTEPGPTAPASPDAGAPTEPPPAPAVDEEEERAKKEMSAGLRHYQRGRFADAIVAYERAAGRKVDAAIRNRARRNARTVQDFSKAWDAGRAAADAQQSASAARSLEEARALDRRLGGYYRGPINEKLAGVYYFQAISAFSRSRYPDALRLNEKVLKLQPSHPLAGNLARKLTETAKNLLAKAKGAPPDRRQKMAQTIIDMTPADSPTHQAARALLAP